MDYSCEFPNCHRSDSKYECCNCKKKYCPRHKEMFPRRENSSMILGICLLCIVDRCFGNITVSKVRICSVKFCGKMIPGDETMYSCDLCDDKFCSIHESNLSYSKELHCIYCIKCALK